MHLSSAFRLLYEEDHLGLNSQGKIAWRFTVRDACPGSLGTIV